MDEEFQKFKEYLEAPKVGIVNPARQRDLMSSYAIIKEIILSEDPDATIEIINDPLQLGSMSIRAVTSDVTVYDTAEFAEATKAADNFQIYPTADGRVKFDVLFEGVVAYSMMDDAE